MKRYVAVTLILAVLSSTYGFASPVMPTESVTRLQFLVVEKFIRTELYFGRNKPNGGTVTESEWQAFVDDFVTPRFPDGLTILDADGQWRGKNGSIAREESKVVVLLYPRKLRKEMSRKIEEIRAEYKKRFEQEAVMRIDVTKSVEVTF